MFEQELQNQEARQQTAPAAVRQIEPEPELFEQYEVKSWNFSPRIYKIVAASAIFNVLAIVVFAQGNLLTRKGCDSPLVSRFCQVLDTVYVGSVLLGTDGEFVSKDYEPTELADAEITYVDVSAQTPPLNYPEGYFALANPEEFALRQQMMDNPAGFEMPPTGSIPFPGIPPASNNNDLMNVTPTLPPQANGSLVDNLPKSPLGGSNPIASNPPASGKTPRVRNQRPQKTPPDKLVDPDDTAENKTDDKKEPETPQPDLKSMPPAEEVINKKPLQDFGDDVLTKVETKKVDLSKPFSVALNGVINKEGKFDETKTRFDVNKDSGDAEMINVAKTAIEAIGDSGILTYLKNLGVENINFELVQNDKEIYAVIKSDQKTESKAKTVSSGLNTLISLAKPTIKEEDTLALLNAAKVESQGKSFVLNFKIEKPIAQEMIKRQLEKAQAKRQQQQQPNGTATVKPNQNSAK